MTTQTSISFLPLLAAAALVGCSSSEPPTLVTTATLTRAQSCDHLLQLLRADAKAKVDMSIDAQIYWLENADDFDLRGVAVEDAGGGEAPTNQGGDLSSAPPSHSETNVQVEGVDEADIVKTDGNYLYLLQGTELAIVNAWPAETMSVGSTQAIEGHPLEMFLTDEHVVVFSTVWQDGGRGVPEWDYGYYGEPLTKVTIFSASGGTASVVDELYFEGSYTSARRIGSQVRLAMNSWYYPTFLGYGLDTWSESRSDMIDAYEELRDKSHARIEAATLPDFVPSRFARQGSELVEVATSCGDFYVPTSGSTQWGYAQLASFDLDNLSAGVKNTTIVGQASTIYSSHDALYIAGQSYSEAAWAVAYSSEEPQSTSYTHVHKFDIATDPAEPTYVASASAPGWVINQFSLDEHEGNLRMATTDTLVGRDTWDTVNNLFTLDGGMHQLGAVTGLAPGESVFSARFVGDRGYVVTFRQVDPL
ncbi:MAG: beta-propeller domain-containing protein, partial [Myxococcales bacterium]|nr:beta-propeller domain-containing protein [Myxococcales bacterium]